MNKSSQQRTRMPRFPWPVEDGIGNNGDTLAKTLGQVHEHLYRSDQGLVEAIPGENRVRVIDSARRLAPILIDHLDIQVMRNGKIVGDLPSERQLNALLNTERFLQHFKPVDVVSLWPVYLDDYSLAPPGYHDGGPGQRILYLGPNVEVADSMEAFERFLAVMDCDGEASRTNILGAALTVLLRRHWAGQKPLVLVTANQSHAGKGTVVQAIGGQVARASVQYQATDWPMEMSLHKQLANKPDIGIIELDNVRKDSGGGGSTIRSAFFESLITSSALSLNSTTVRSSITRRNDFVVCINTNEGTVSADLLNRSLWIHLAPQGDIHERKSPIGNPKEEYLPQHQPQMEAELLGLIARWKAAGCPLHEDVYHPMSLWAKTVGGILHFGGYKGFLANYRQAAQQIDPYRRAVAILGATSLHGLSSSVDNHRYGEVGRRLMDEMWKVVKGAKLTTTGINHWVYFADDRMFVGVEVRVAEQSTIPKQLEPCEVELTRYAKHVHIGPYHELPQKWQSLKAELSARSEIVTMPSLEVYGHSCEGDDDSKAETTILMGLKPIGK